MRVRLEFRNGRVVYRDLADPPSPTKWERTDDFYNGARVWREK